MAELMRYAQLVKGGKTIKQGEIFELAFQLFGSDNIITVPTVDQTIAITIANNSGTVYETTAVVVDNKIQFTVSENIGYGQMRLEIKVTEGTTLIQKYPSDGWIILNITKSLDDANVGGINAVTATQMRSEITAIETSVGVALTDAAEAKLIAETVQTEFDSIVAEAGSSNPEIVLARGEFTTLEGRLDATNVSLAEKAEQAYAEATNLRVDNLVIPLTVDNSNIQVTDALVSTAKSKSFTTVRNRFEEIELAIKSAFRNYIVDGGFLIDANADGIADNFRLPAGIVGSLVGGIQSFTPTAAYNSLQYFPIVGNAIDRYYITALVKSSKNTTQLRIKDVSTTPLFPHSGSGQFERLSMIGVPNGTNRAVYVTEIATSGFTEIQTSKMMAINLKAFKVEPTIVELDAMVELFGSYFEGELNPNETQEAFLKSWIEKRTETDDKIQDVLNTVETTGGNLYKKVSHFTADEYSKTDGTVATSPNWGLARVPVTALKDYSIQLPNYGIYSGGIGSVAFYQDGTLLSFVYPANSEINGQYNAIDFITVTTPINCNRLHVTAKVNGVYDDSDTLIVVKGVTITDNSLIGYLKSFAGAVVPTVDNQLTYQGKIIACLGDSLTEKNATAPINYVDLIAERMGFDARNFGDGGTGYMRSYELGTSFYQRAVNLPTDADIITIFGSGNDLAHSATLGATKDVFDDANKTIAGCINHTINIIQTNHPRAQIGIIAPTPWSTTPTTSGNQMSAYVDLLESICKSRGIPFLNLFRRSNLRPWESVNNSLFFYNSDGTHPNDDGHELFIYPPFREFIKSMM